MWAEQVGLLAAEPPFLTAPEFGFQRIAEEDPNLALAGLRIEIEKRLVKLSESRNVEVRSRGVGQLLSDRQDLSKEASPRLLKTLDDLVEHAPVP